MIEKKKGRNNRRTENRKLVSAADKAMKTSKVLLQAIKIASNDNDRSIPLRTTCKQFCVSHSIIIGI
jgi:hypothetical protein